MPVAGDEAKPRRVAAADNDDDDVDELITHAASHWMLLLLLRLEISSAQHFRIAVPDNALDYDTAKTRYNSCT